jgi:putative Ca2+/H+ antiporter (TMEM165/GDT1 family)
LDFILPLLLTALALEIGDRTQLLAGLLGARYRKPLPVLVGIFAAALLLSGIAAFGGKMAAEMINNRAATLLLGLALVSGGIGGFLAVKPAEPIDRWRIGALASSFGAFFILAALDKTMFAVFAFGAVSPQWPVLAVAAAIGTTLANAPAVVLGQRLVLPRWVRPLIGGVLILAGIYLAIGALGLI